MKDHYLH